MATYIAHYRSLDSQSTRTSGLFEFESAARVGSKTNAYDARLHMLEEFGNEALAWNIFKIEKKCAKDGQSDGQMQLDFRAPKRKIRSKRGGWQDGQQSKISEPDETI